MLPKSWNWAELGKIQINISRERERREERESKWGRRKRKEGRMEESGEEREGRTVRDPFDCTEFVCSSKALSDWVAHYRSTISLQLQRYYDQLSGHL